MPASLIMAKEIVLTKPRWIGGQIKPVETVVSLPDADAGYLVSIGAADFVVDETPEAPAEETQAQVDEQNSLIGAAKKKYSAKIKAFLGKD